MNPLLKELIVLATVIVCAIPERYRRSWPVKHHVDLRGPAIASGLLEFLLGAPGAVFYVATALSVAKGGYGAAGLVLNPFLPFLFMFAEGGVRFLAALTSEQVLPTLPLWIIARIHDVLDGRNAERRLGPLVVDRIDRGKGTPYDLRVSSCRPKPHWNPYMTVRFEEEFYQMFKEDVGSGNLQFVYLLRKHPVGRVVVVVYEYHPDDVHTPAAEPKRWLPG